MSQINQLVTSKNDEILTTTLILAEGVNNSHKSVIQLIRLNIEDLQEFGPLAFEMRKGEKLDQGGYGKSTEYAYLNEQQSTLLITYMRNNEIVKRFKKTLIKAFYEMRKSLEFKIPETMSEALRLAADTLDENKKLTAKVEEDAPKVAFHDQVVNSQDAITVREAAKLLGTGQNRLFSFLRRIAWVTRYNEPYQSKIESGYLDIKIGSWNHPEQGLKRSITTLITGKGLAKLREELKKLNPLRLVGGSYS